MKSIIKTENLSHKYSTAWAIRDINIDIDEYGTYGLVGANGAGKSTTMKIICGTLKPTTGRVLINGVDIQENPIKAKKQLGFCPQTVPLYDDLTAREYLIYSAGLRLTDKERIPEAVNEVMDECGILNLKNRLLKNLSGGYRQRVALAQAIIHKPKLVILDEPTTGLDPVKIAELHNLIKKIAQNSTVIISSHILSEIKAVCEHIVMIEQGQVVFSDSTEAFENYMAPDSMVLTLQKSPSVYELESVDGVTRVEKQTPKKFQVFLTENLLMK